MTREAIRKSLDLLDGSLTATLPDGYEVHIYEVVDEHDGPSNYQAALFQPGVGYVSLDRVLYESTEPDEVIDTMCHRFNLHVDDFVSSVSD